MLISATEMVMQVPNLWWAGSANSNLGARGRVASVVVSEPQAKVPRFSLPNFRSPLKDGDLILTCEPGVEKDVNFAFDVALLEPEIMEGRSLIASLHRLAERGPNAP
jgi:hypothetical protein